MHKSIAASPRGHLPSTKFGTQAIFLTVGSHIQPASKSSIGIYAMIYWIGPNGWQCNNCAAHDYTRALLLQLDLSLLSVSASRCTLYAPLYVRWILVFVLLTSRLLAPCMCTRPPPADAKWTQSMRMKTDHTRRIQVQCEYLQGGGGDAQHAGQIRTSEEDQWLPRRTPHSSTWVVPPE